MVYVCGHQNPDTDSIVAAIAYAQLRGEGTQAVRLGELSPETRFVLDRFSFEYPLLMMSARTQMSDIDIDQPMTVTENTTITEAWEFMKQRQIITLFVVDENMQLIGIISPGDIADSVLRTVYTPNLGDMSLSQLCEKLQNGEHCVRELMTKDKLVTFNINETLDDVRSKMLMTRFRSYPVTDDQKRVIGSVSRFHLIKHKRKQFVLVDHNEKSQSVPSIEQADIIEIIDHHRLGDIQTGSPVFFRNEPVGSTTTIIAGMFQEVSKTPSKSLAGLMLAGILSDTVLYKSPTCTEKDKRMAAWLSEIAGVEDQKLGRELFAAFDAELLSHTPRQIFFHDFKEYLLGGKKVGIGQITVWSSQSIPTAEIQAFIHKLRASERFDLLIFMQTEIVKEGTLFVYSCDDYDLLRRTFGIEPDKKPFFITGMMSRKKQVVPAIRAVLA